MQTFAFFLGLVLSIIYLLVWVNTIIEAIVWGGKKNCEMPNSSLIILFAALLSWTWLFYLTH